MRLTILGTPSSKGNSRQVWRVKGKRRVVIAPSKKFLTWQEDATLQIKASLHFWKARYAAEGRGQIPIDEPVSIAATFYRDARADLDNLQKALGDVLQHAGVLKNDRQIKGWVSILRPHNGNPRVELEIAPMREAA